MRQYNNTFDFDWGGTSTGTEPSNTLKANGFQGGYKPPAGVFNWFWHKVIKCITELQSSVPDVVDNLTSTSTTDALSAMQGKTLKGLIPTVVNNLTSYSTTSALSAYQGRILYDTLMATSFNGKSVTLHDGSTVTGGIGSEIYNDFRDRTYASSEDERDANSGNVATGQYAHAEGSSTTATGIRSHAEGSRTVASGHAAHAENYYTMASGAYSHSGGQQSIASGNYSFAHGYMVNATKQFQNVFGKCNNPDVISTTDTVNYDAIFSVGYGSSDSDRKNALSVFLDGKVKGQSYFSSSGADYAEFFEWLDGNSNNEDRRGKLVTLDGDKIRLANSNDTFILGVISANSSFLGNDMNDFWQGKYLKDVFGETIKQPVEIPEITDEETGEVIPAHIEMQDVINPDYDPEMEYASRESRKEWAKVGLVGQLVVIDDGSCTVNGYCKPSENGIGTSGESGYRVLQRIDATHIKVLVK